MTKIMYCGDIHGNSDALERIFDKAEVEQVDFIVQLGDLGLWWPKTSEWNNNVFKREYYNRERKVPFYFIDGNHDNHNFLIQKYRQTAIDGIPRCPVEIEPNVFYLSRCSMVDIGGITHLSCGGAYSIDKAYRTPNISWWENEEPTEKQIELFYIRGENYKPTVILTHDAPISVPIYKDIKRNHDQEYFDPKTGLTYNDRTRYALQRAFDELTHKPEYWFYGHHHVLREDTINGTTFIGTGFEGEHKIVNF